MPKILIYIAVVLLGCVQPVISQATDIDSNEVIDAKIRLSQLADYHRSEDQTYLTLPEWYIVYSYDEYAAFIKDHAPSGFAYFGSIREFWSIYNHIYAVTKNRFPMNWGYHGMIAVIGVSFTVEYVVKGFYENTIGRLTEWSADNKPTEEDLFIRQAEYDFAVFTHLKPWYEFPFGERLSAFYTQTHWFGENLLRKWERKSFFIQQYSLKAIYAWALGAGTQASYDAEADTIYALIHNDGVKRLLGEPSIRIIEEFSDKTVLLKIPRYEAFQTAVKMLALQGVKFIEIAGNDEILVTAIVKHDRSLNNVSGEFLFNSRVVTHPELKRVALKVSVVNLSQVISELERDGATIEHIYDY